jgi:hypothetical protein
VLGYQKSTASAPVYHISFFPTKVNLANDDDLYSASNSTSVVSVIVLGIIIGQGLDIGSAKVDWCVISADQPPADKTAWNSTTVEFEYAQ